MAATMSVWKSFSVNLFGLLGVRRSYIGARLASSSSSSVRIKGGARSISTWSQQQLRDEKGSFFSVRCSKYGSITSTGAADADVDGNGDRDGKEKGYLELTDQELMSQCQLNTFKASGPGGQHRNKRESAVRLKHLPTGLIAQVCCFQFFLFLASLFPFWFGVKVWAINLILNLFTFSRLLRIGHSTWIVHRP